MAILEKKTSAPQRRKSAKPTCASRSATVPAEKKQATSSENVSSEAKKPIWEVVAEIGAQIPLEEWAKLPDDASINYRHYLYGAPKRDT